MKRLLALFFITPLLCSGAEQGEVAPGFQLPELGAQNTRSLESYRGKVVYLDFWASWCAPCRISIPEFIQLKSDLADMPFEIVGINVDENPADAERFLKRYQINYPILSDPAADLAGVYQLPGMPTAFIIDGSGNIHSRHIGFKPGDAKQIRATIEALLRESEQ